VPRKGREGSTPSPPTTGHRPDGLDRYPAIVADDNPGDALDADGAAGKSALVRAAESVADTVVDVATQAGTAAGRLVASQRERRRRPKRHEALLNLYDVHPEARLSSRRQLGVLTIPVNRIRGTAVEGAAQRGSDFLPLPGLRGTNWRGRWQRLRAAQERLAVLPPIDVLQTDDGYWVLDGHNRVALAREVGQDDVDASVVHVHLPGSHDTNLPRGSLASVLSDSLEVRSAARSARPDEPRETS
jgi:hypothetical protein